MQKQTIEILVQVIKKLRQFPFADLSRFVLLSLYIKQGRDFSNHSKASMTRLIDVSKRFSRRLRWGIPIDETEYWE